MFSLLSYTSHVLIFNSCVFIFESHSFVLFLIWNLNFDLSFSLCSCDSLRSWHDSSSTFLISTCSDDRKVFTTNLMNITLYTLQLASNLVTTGFDLGYWVKPRNTPWFFVFLLIDVMMNDGFRISRCQRIHCLTI